MKRLYLHIGAHKTGSTSVQLFLRQNRPALRQAGYLVPRPINKDPQFGIAHLCQQPRSAMPMSRRVRLQLEAQHVVEQLRETECEFGIISSENFSWLRDVASVKRVFDLLAETVEEIRVIHFVRRQDQLAVSHHQQGLRGWPLAYNYYGGDGPFDRVFSHDWNYLDYYQRYLNWAEVFGEENFHLEIFDPQQFRQGNLVQHFLGLCGLDWPADAIPPILANESLTAAGQLMLEHLDSQWPVVGKRWEVARRRELIDRVEAWDLLQTGKRSRLLPARASAEAFYARFAESNELLRRRLFPNKDKVFTENFDHYPETDGRFSVDHKAYNDLLCDLLESAQLASPREQAAKKQGV